MLTIVGNGTNRVMPTYGEDRFGAAMHSTETQILRFFLL